MNSQIFPIPPPQYEQHQLNQPQCTEENRSHISIPFEPPSYTSILNSTYSPQIFIRTSSRKSQTRKEPQVVVIETDKTESQN